MTRNELAFIRSLIETEHTDTEILDALADYAAEREASDAEAAEYEERAFGTRDHRDDWTSAQREMDDRLSMGRNEAGEWLGFM